MEYVLWHKDSNTILLQSELEYCQYIGNQIAKKKGYRKSPIHKLGAWASLNTRPGDIADLIIYPVNTTGRLSYEAINLLTGEEDGL